MLALLTAGQETEESPTWQAPCKHLTETGKHLLTLRSQAQEGVLSGDLAVKRTVSGGFSSVVPMTQNLRTALRELVCGCG